MSSNRKATATDVAKRANVSQSTVSRVFNQHEYINTETRERVLNASRELNYQPPARHSTKVIGLGIPHKDSSYYFSNLINNMKRATDEHDVHFEIINPFNHKLLKENHLSGLITTVELERIFKNSSFDHRSLGIPILTINREYPNLPSCSFDQANGVEIAMEYLIENGHKTIGLLAKKPDLHIDDKSSLYLQRMYGYQQVLRKYKIPFDKKLTLPCDEERLVENLAILLRRNVTAIVVAEEGYGLYVQYALSLLNVSIPADLSVISCEAENISQFLHPPQTTINQNIHDLSVKAVEKMINLIENKDNSELHSIIKSDLIIRDSVKSIT